MTKNEKYDALKAKGINMKHINNLSSDEVDKLYIQNIVDKSSGNTPSENGTDTGADTGETNPSDQDGDNQTSPDSGNTPSETQTKNTTAKKVLEFETSGWCEELKTSYKKGLYHPKSDKEYKALKKYSVQE